MERFRDTDERAPIRPMGVLRYKDRVQRDREREQNEQIRTAVQARSASGFLSREEDTWG
jgi:hypothetical protein